MPAATAKAKAAKKRFRNMFSSVLNLRGNLISSFFAQQDVTRDTFEGASGYQRAFRDTLRPN
jgi:hypothetical protein